VPPIDTERIEAAVVEILAAIGEDLGRPGLEATPGHVASAYAEFFSGIGVDPVAQLQQSADVLADADRLGDLVLMRDIEFRSTCEHHLLPFRGVAHLAYAPGKRVVGLGALARVVETLALRPQLQERLTEEIADALEAGLAPVGALVVVEARHDCVSDRGARQAGSTVVSMATRGSFTDPVARAEVMSLIGTRP
jgi:GTP cyclohydrolase I